MAKIELNPVIGAIRGKIGNIVCRQISGRMVISAIPDFSGRKLSANQIAANRRFKEATFRWKGLSASVRAGYQARAKELQMPPFALFQKDWHGAPIVERLDLSQYSGQADQSIAVRATDLFEVAAVEVKIRGTGGGLIESGAAVRAATDRDRWIYTTTATAPNPSGVTVEATATSWPGKRDSRMQLLPPPSVAPQAGQSFTR